MHILLGEETCDTWNKPKLSIKRLKHHYEIHGPFVVFHNFSSFFFFRKFLGLLFPIFLKGLLQWGKIMSQAVELFRIRHPNQPMRTHISLKIENIFRVWSPLAMEINAWLYIFSRHSPYYYFFAISQILNYAISDKMQIEMRPLCFQASQFMWYLA